MELGPDELAYWWWRWHGTVSDQCAGVDPGGVRALNTWWLAAGLERGQKLLSGSGTDCRRGVEGGVGQEQRDLVGCLQGAEQGRGCLLYTSPSPRD